MTVRKFLNEFELYLGAVASGAMFVVLLAQVISRYVFNRAFSWSEELALILFVWSIYFGAVAAIRRHQNLRLEILLDKLSPRNRLIMEIIGNCFYMLFSGIVLFGVMPIVIRLFNSGTSTAVMGIPKWINYSVIPAMFTLALFRMVQDSVARVQDFRLRKSPADKAKQGE
jgi:TRAP-type C4-dicarboxylate transport system permease small subunit